MKREEILESLQEIFRDVFGDNGLTISEATGTVDIEGWDSLKQISILEAVQDDFNVRFSLEEMIELKDVKKITDAIISHQ